MKIALVGYGNMGRELEKLVGESEENKIVSISYRHRNWGLDKKGIKKADVVIDFTSPDIVLQNIKEVARLKKNLVIGTTGWYDKLDEVKEIIKKNKIGLIYGQNFSIGANIFYRIVALSSKLFAKFSDNYDVYGLEIHHRGKKDSPSGTAKKLAEIIMKNFTKKKVLQNSSLNRKITEEELHFGSVRGGFNPGFHEVTFDSLADEVRLSHGARSRRGFVQGALMSAKFIKGKKGLFSFDDVFNAEVGK